MLSQSTNEAINEELVKHIDEKYNGEKPPKSKPQKEMNPDQRTKVIQNMLAKGNLNVGIAPISADHIARVEKVLISRGVISENENPAARKQRTVKSLVKSWTTKYLKMTDRDWDPIEIDNILMTDNSDVVFLCCKTQNDVNKFTSRAWNIPHDDGANPPCLLMFVDRRVSKRHKAIVKIAKTLREHSDNSVQTSICVGKTDFLLRQRPQGTTTPWAEIPPISLTQELPDFEVGTYTDVLETLKIMQIEQNQLDNQMDDNIDDIENIVQDISRQNELNNKRERTSDDSSGMEKKLMRKKLYPCSNP